MFLFLPENRLAARFRPALAVRLVLDFAPAASLWTFPVRTLSRSEKGFERTTQGIALLARWPLRGPIDAAVRMRVEKGV